MSIGYLLKTPFDILVEQIHIDIAQAGFPEVRIAHGPVFVYIGNGARLTELAERANMTKQSMSYLVEYLEEHGYVERTNDETDKRAKIFILTDKGRQVNAVADKSIKKFESDCKKKLGNEKFKLLLSLLKELHLSLASNLT